MPIKPEKFVRTNPVAKAHAKIGNGAGTHGKTEKAMRIQDKANLAKNLKKGELAEDLDDSASSWPTQNTRNSFSQGSDIPNIAGAMSEESGDVDWRDFLDRQSELEKELSSYIVDIIKRGENPLEVLQGSSILQSPWSKSIVSKVMKQYNSSMGESQEEYEVPDYVVDEIASKEFTSFEKFINAIMKIVELDFTGNSFNVGTSNSKTIIDSDGIIIGEYDNFSNKGKIFGRD